MSCNCQHIKTADGQTFSCLCDQFEHPKPLNIGAGLVELPRQIAGFPQFRRAMLRDIRQHSSLTGWNARHDDDLGIMLLEMWAYLCDSLSFYDAVLAHEAYVDTARRRPSLRKLTALLGYLPIPAVGGKVQIAAFAEGRQLVKIPSGTAFSSGAFEGNPPQVFETEADTNIHPLANKWNLQPPSLDVLSQANPVSLSILPSVALQPNDFLLLIDPDQSSQTQALRVQNIQPQTGIDKRQYHILTFSMVTSTPLSHLERLQAIYGVGFSTATNLAIGTPLSRLQLFRANYTTALWTKSEKAIVGYNITLDAQHRNLHNGDYIMLQRGRVCYSYRIEAVREVSRSITGNSIMHINGASYQMPGQATTVTELTLHALIPWSDSLKEEITVFFGLQSVGKLAAMPKTTIADTDIPLQLNATDTPAEGYQPTAFIMRDKNNFGAALVGEINYQTQQIAPKQGQNWPQMALPVQVFGNILTATRGETVRNETLGNGNAAQANQTFKLKKKPLTYLSEPTAGSDTGLKNTLQVRINGILWREVRSFYGQKPDAQIYIVRQNDDNDTLVTFGDSKHGQRPNTGDTVTANYRFGAGRAAPPAGSISQIKTPVKGLQSIKNYLAADGGADAETAENLRQNAPKSALLLGRAVSMPDFEAVAMTFPGVRAAQAEWRWHPQRQAAVAHLTYIGSGGIAADLTTRLRSVTDPSLIIAAEPATAVTVRLHINVEIDPRYTASDTIQSLRKRLTAPAEGFLTPEKLGVGRPIYRSQIFAEALKTEGITAVKSILWNGDTFNEFAKTPGAGRFFDIENTLIINGL